MAISVPGLRYLADWVAPDDARDMLDAIDAETWSTQLRRRVQHYGHRYDYGRRGVDPGTDDAAPPIPDWAWHVVERLAREDLMDRRAEQVIVNEYQPGQGISAHIDCLPCFGPVVAALSLGSSCVMDFTDPDSGAKVPVTLAPGSLVVMSGPARYAWRHAIAARKSDPAGGVGAGTSSRIPRGRRVSVTFRTLVPLPVSGAPPGK